MRDARDSMTSAALAALIALSSTCGAVRGQDCTFDWAEGFNLPGLEGDAFASVAFNEGAGNALDFPIGIAADGAVLRPLSDPRDFAPHDRHVTPHRLEAKP